MRYKMDADIGYIFQNSTAGFLFYYLDFLLISCIFLLVGFSISTFINYRLTDSLDRTKSKIVIFGEIMLESLLTITFVILAMYLLPKIPSIVPHADPKHKLQRIIAKDFLLTFAVLACQTKFQDKIRYLLNPDEDKKVEVLDSISVKHNFCVNNGLDSFACAPP